MRLMKLLVFLTLTAVLAACAGNGSGDDPAVAVETYLQAKVAGDGDTIQALLCSEQEQNLAREKQTFARFCAVSRSKTWRVKSKRSPAWLKRIWKIWPVPMRGTAV